MVQQSFTVGTAGSLATVLLDISSGADAAANTPYTVTMSAAIFSPSESVSLLAGSSLTLEGPFPFIVDAFAVTGTLTTDLNFTGTVTLDNGVLDNVAVASNTGGTVVAGLYTGVVLGTAGDAGDTAINNGTISFGGASAAIQFGGGTVQNGWNGAASALVSGAGGGVQLTTSGLVQNGGTIIASGPTTTGVLLGAGTIDNGQIGATTALISGGEYGVVINGAGAVDNDGSIIGVTSDAVYLVSGSVTNGQVGDVTALIAGGDAGGHGVWIGAGAGSVGNFGSITGGGASGVYLTGGGTVTNGAVSDTTALIGGAAEGVLFGAVGSLFNYGTVQASGVGVAPPDVGAFLEAGGTIENLTTASMIDGLQWGAVVEGAKGFVSNLGTIQASDPLGIGAELTAGGTVVNGLTAGSAATLSGGFDGVRISAGAAGAGAVVQNDGTITGAVGVDFASGAAPAAGTLTNDGLIASTSGTSGEAVVFGAGAETLVLQSVGAFIGDVLGNNASGSSTTLELAAGTQGTLSGLGNDAGTLTDNAGSFTFSEIGTIALDAGANWVLSAPGTLDTLHNAGALSLSGGAVTVTGSLINSGSLGIGGNTLTATTGMLADQGVITVAAGGLLKADGGGISAAGTSAIQVGGGTAAALDVTGAGATVNSNGFRIGVGSSGEGFALISQGATVLAGTPFAADEAIYTGGSAGATGALTITDAGSQLRATGQFSVGFGGNGSLLIENQATVVTGNDTHDRSAGFDVGQLATAAGDATVTGSDSLLSNTGRFVVGDAGLGSLSIQSGATVTTSPGTVAGLSGAVIANTTGASGSSVNVTGTGSNWQITGGLTVGDAGSGALNITSGATVTAATLDAGAQSTGAGIVTISGDNASLVTTGSLSVGDAGAGELSILNGANATIGGDLDIGLAGGSGNIDIDGAAGTLTLNANIVAGTGAAVLTIGPNSTLVQDNGGVIAGQNFVENVYGNLDPAFADGGTVNVKNSETITYTAYVANTTFDMPQGVTFTLETPTVYGTTSFNLGGSAADTSGSELIANAGSFGSGSSVTFNDALSTLVIGIDQLATIDVPPSGTSGFTAVPNPDLGMTLIGEFGGTIKDFLPGDTIVVDTSVAATFAQSGSVVSVIANGTTLGVLRFDNAADALAASVTPGALVDQVAPCFAAGTRIAMERGEVAVEDVRVGDRVRVVLGGGFAEVVWVGRREVACGGHAQPRKVWPVRVGAGAFGVGVPVRDVWLSPDHAVFVGGVLIPVKLLVNGVTITQVPVERVTYCHVELAEHDVLLAEGLPAESYLDMRDGSNYAHRAGAMRLVPDYAARMWEAFGCAKLVVTGVELERAREVVRRWATASEAEPSPAEYDEFGAVASAVAARVTLPSDASRAVA